MGTKEKKETKKFAYSRKNFWTEADKKDVAAAHEFSADYINFLNNCKNVRETINVTEETLKANGFKEMFTNKQVKKFTLFLGTKQWRLLLSVRSLYQKA